MSIQCGWFGGAGCQVQGDGRPGAAGEEPVPFGWVSRSLASRSTSSIRNPAVASKWLGPAAVGGRGCGRGRDRRWQSLRPSPNQSEPRRGPYEAQQSWLQGPGPSARPVSNSQRVVSSCLRRGVHRKSCVEWGIGQVGSGCGCLATAEVLEVSTLDVGARNRQDHDTGESRGHPEDRGRRL